MITKEYLQQELAKRIKGYKPGVETTTDNIIAEMKSILVLVDALEKSEHLADTRKTLEIKPGDEVTINGHKIVYDKDKGYVTIVKSEESVPNDLEEAASEFSTNEADRAWGKPDPHDYTDHSGCGAAHANYEAGLYVGFKAGAKWKADHTPLPEDTVLFNKGVEEGKRLMMMDAVDAIVEDWNPDPEPEITIPLNPEEFTRGDKVRIIIVKECEK